MQRYEVAALSVPVGVTPKAPLLIEAYVGAAETDWPPHLTATSSTIYLPAGLSPLR